MMPQEAYENFLVNRNKNPRSATSLARANVLYLVDTGRMELPDNLDQDFLYSWQSKYEYGELRKKAQREDGIFHLDSKTGIYNGHL